ncbi:hypothetical protein UACE39S_00608 [Ureibacillus acetophenoni]
MKYLKKFSFWLPLFSLALIVFELIFQPVKHPWMAMDPIFTFLFAFLHPVLPDNQSIIFALGLHFLLAILYGLLLDRYLPKLREKLI